MGRHAKKGWSMRRGAVLAVVVGLVMATMLAGTFGGVAQDATSTAEADATASPGASPVGSPVASPVGLAGDVEAGKALASQCLSCHSVDGSAMVGPTWKGLYGEEVELDDGTTVIADDAYLAESITDPGAKIVKGFPAGAMPPYGVDSYRSEHRGSHRLYQIAWRGRRGRRLASGILWTQAGRTAGDVFTRGSRCYWRCSLVASARRIGCQPPVGRIQSARGTLSCVCHICSAGPCGPRRTMSRSSVIS